MKAPNTPVDKAIEHIVERGAKLSSHQIQTAVDWADKAKSR